MTGMSGFDFDLGSDAPRDMFQFFTEDSSRPLPESASAVQSPPLPPGAFKKSKWSPDEDERLRQNVETHGLGNWSLISQGLPGRNGKQCRERWMNQLSPALNKDNWTPQEDAVLIQQQRIYGNVWSRIAQFLPGRSPNSVKNRWSWLSRHAISSALAMRMIPMLAQAQRPVSPHPRIVLPELSRGQEFTAPPDLQWPEGSPIIEDGVPAPAFSDPTDFAPVFAYKSTVSDAEASAALPERIAETGDEPFRPFDDWSF
jgi:hypothetical protein